MLNDVNEVFCWNIWANKTPILSVSWLSVASNSRKLWLFLSALRMAERPVFVNSFLDTSTVSRVVLFSNTGTNNEVPFTPIPTLLIFKCLMSGQASRIDFLWNVLLQS